MANSAYQRLVRLTGIVLGVLTLLQLFVAVLALAESSSLLVAGVDLSRLEILDLILLPLGLVLLLGLALYFSSALSHSRLRGVSSLFACYVGGLAIAALLFLDVPRPELGEPRWKLATSTVSPVWVLSLLKEAVSGSKVLREPEPLAFVWSLSILAGAAGVLNLALLGLSAAPPGCRRQMANALAPSTTQAAPGRRWLRGALRWCFLMVMVLALVLVVGAWCLSYKRLKVENYDLIQPGMSQREVEELLGGPPGKYGLRVVPGSIDVVGGVRIMHGLGWARRETYQILYWYDNDTRIEVQFGAGRVEEKHQPPVDSQLRDLCNYLRFW